MSASSPTPSVTPSRTPSITPTVSVTNTPTVSVSITRTPTISPSRTPAAQYDYILYLAHTSPFYAAEVSVGTAGALAGTSVLIWEYWDGANWSTIGANGGGVSNTFNLRETVTDLANFENTTPGVVYWDSPTGWSTTSVNGAGPYYWVRIRSNSNNITDTQALLNYIRLTVPPSPTPSTTPSISISVTPSISISATPSITPSISISNTPSITPSISISKTPSFTPSITPSISISKTPSFTPSITPSITVSRSISATPSITPSISISKTPSITPTVTPSKTPITLKPFLTNGAWSLSITGSPLCTFTTYNTTLYFDGTGTYPTIGDRIYEFNNPDTPNIYRAGNYTVMDNGVGIQLDSGGYVVDVQACPSPSTTPSITISPSKTPTVTISVTPSVSPLDCSINGGQAVIVPSPTPSVTPTISITPTRTITPTPSKSPAAPGTITLTYSNVASGTARVYKNGVSFLTRTTLGSTSGAINTGDTFYGNIILGSTYNASITISSNSRGTLYDNTSLTGGLTSDTFTRQTGENITVTIGSYVACFVEGTLITLPNGELVPIETLKDGDILLSEKIQGLDDTNNINKLFEWTSNIINTNKTTSTIGSITKHLSDSTIIINNGLLQATKYHNQLIQRDGKWKFIPFGDIILGDNLLSNNNEIIEVKSIEIDETEKVIYKITLSDESHTYYANNILTHNIK